MRARLTTAVTFYAGDESFCVGKEDGIYADRHDCTAFYVCSGDRTFRKFCPTGQKFNPLISNCDNPENVNCQEKDQYLGLQAFENHKEERWTERIKNYDEKYQRGAHRVVGGTQNIGNASAGWYISSKDVPHVDKNQKLIALNSTQFADKTNNVNEIERTPNNLAAFSFNASTSKAALEQAFDHVLLSNSEGNVQNTSGVRDGYTSNSSRTFGEHLSANGEEKNVDVLEELGKKGYDIKENFFVDLTPHSQIKKNLTREVVKVKEPMRGKALIGTGQPRGNKTEIFVGCTNYTLSKQESDGNEQIKAEVGSHIGKEITGNAEIAGNISAPTHHVDSNTTQGKESKGNGENGTKGLNAQMSTLYPENTNLPMIFHGNTNNKEEELKVSQSTSANKSTVSVFNTHNSTSNSINVETEGNEQSKSEPESVQNQVMQRVLTSNYKNNVSPNYFNQDKTESIKNLDKSASGYEGDFKTSSGIKITLEKPGIFQVATKRHHYQRSDGLQRQKYRASQKLKLARNKNISRSKLRLPSLLGTLINKSNKSKVMIMLGSLVRRPVALTQKRVVNAKDANNSITQHIYEGDKEFLGDMSTQGIILNNNEVENTKSTDAPSKGSEKNQHSYVDIGHNLNNRDGAYIDDTDDVIIDFNEKQRGSSPVTFTKQSGINEVSYSEGQQRNTQGYQSDTGERYEKKSKHSNIHL